MLHDIRWQPRLVKITMGSSTQPIMVSILFRHCLTPWDHQYFPSRTTSTSPVTTKQPSATSSILKLFPGEYLVAVSGWRRKRAITKLMLLTSFQRKWIVMCQRRTKAPTTNKVADSPTFTIDARGELEPGGDGELRFFEFVQSADGYWDRLKPHTVVRSSALDYQSVLDGYTATLARSVTALCHSIPPADTQAFQETLGRITRALTDLLSRGLVSPASLVIIIKDIAKELSADHEGTGRLFRLVRPPRSTGWQAQRLQYATQRLECVWQMVGVYERTESQVAANQLPDLCIDQSMTTSTVTTDTSNTETSLATPQGPPPSDPGSASSAGQPIHLDPNDDVRRCQIDEQVQRQIQEIATQFDALQRRVQRVDDDHVQSEQARALQDRRERLRAGLSVVPVVGRGFVVMEHVLNPLGRLSAPSTPTPTQTEEGSAVVVSSPTRDQRVGGTSRRLTTRLRQHGQGLADALEEASGDVMGALL